jgi:hypothetical protein
MFKDREVIREHWVQSGTNKTITVRRLRMTLTKRVEKGKDESGIISLLMRTLKCLKRGKFPLL